MIQPVLILCLGGLTLAILLGLFRLARGPTVLDRILAFDLIATSAVGMVVLLSVLWRTAVYLELILIFSLLGFVSTVAFVFYLHRTREQRRTKSAANPVPPANPSRWP
ncbi:MAG: K+/H+ antiporter subunit F [Verrucomicrobia bacterium]|jgi:multisubunit Na+/H+ antiporter MnhF subunit|nr:K+/H+ antiporter subunit F [Verrucomicrobiota bacterium]